MNVRRESLTATWWSTHVDCRLIVGDRIAIEDRDTQERAFSPRVDAIDDLLLAVELGFAVEVERVGLVVRLVSGRRSISIENVLRRSKKERSKSGEGEQPSGGKVDERRWTCR